MTTEAGELRGPPAGVLGVQLVVAVALVPAVVARAPHEHWDFSLLLVLVGFAVASDLIAVETGSAKLKLSGSFASIVVAMAVIGGTGALLVATAAISVGWLRWREAGHYLRNNLISFATFSFLTGTAFQMAVSGRVAHRSPAYYLLIFAAFGVALVLNFCLVAGYQCLIDGSSLRTKSTQAFLPVLSSELASALLACGTVYVYESTSLTGLALIGVVVVVFQYLVRQLLLSQQRSEALQYQAVTDPLTGLPNRTVLITRLEAALEEGRTQAVMLMDLDGFKEVNDALGHDYGDALLVVLSARIREALRPDALLARLGGDEFAIMVEGLEHGHLEDIARRLLQVLEEPVQIGEMTLEVSGSIGIARSPDDGGIDSHDLIRRADVAMYSAKKSGATFEFYLPSDDHHSPRKLNMLGDLRRGIAAGELFLEFQPEVGIARPGMRAAEALVRWEHPAHGRLPPSEFVGLAEHSGLIKPLTEHVLDLALSAAQNWRQAGLTARVAVNLSARVLCDRHLPEQIASQLANAGLSADALALEMTETMILGDPARAIKTLERLRSMGIELAIDDFGTGYSSLAYLKHLPISEVKVDRSFVSSMTADAADDIIVRSTLDLARSLGMRTVGEGVENLATLRRLAELGCDLVQGFHLSRPLPAADLLAWALQENRRDTHDALASTSVSAPILISNFSKPTPPELTPKRLARRKGAPSLLPLLDEFPRT